MSNMSYCRWENTYRNLVECLNYDGRKLSEDEESFRKRMFKLMCKSLDVDIDYEDWLGRNDWTIDEDERECEDEADE